MNVFTYTPEAIRSVVQEQAQVFKLPWELVMAVCVVESSLNPWAIRYEPSYRWLVGDSLTDTEREGQKISWGLMQVMGAVAREHGFKGWFPELCDPAQGVFYGCRHLRKFHNLYEEWQKTIASYNAGSPRYQDGVLVNQSYVDKVLKEWNRLEVFVPLKPSEV